MYSILIHERLCKIAEKKTHDLAKSDKKDNKTDTDRTFTNNLKSLPLT